MHTSTSLSPSPEKPRAIPAAAWRWRVVDIVVASVIGVASGLIFLLWNVGYLGPKALPANLVDYWNKALRAAVAKPEVQKRFTESGMATIIGSPAEFKATIRADRKKWQEVIQAAGMRAD